MDLLGAGACSRVYRAAHEETGDEVALKLLDAAAGAASRAYFVQEVELLRGLDHPGIVGFRDAGEHQGVPWLAMELLAGPTLDQRLGAGPLEWPEAIRLFRDLAEVLVHLHGRGFTHRDIKPANLMLDATGALCLIDLGIAATLTADAGLSLTGLGAGTPRYMSPEQVLGQPATAASDIYSAGVCLFEALTGESPYPETTEAAVLAAHVQRPPRALDELVRAPPALSAIVALCLAKQARGRYDSALDLAADLGAVLADAAVATGKTHAGRKLGLRREGQLYGRARETRVVTRWLERGLGSQERAMLLVRGPSGSGRSAVLQWAVREARRLGYSLAGATAAADGPRLRVVDQAGASLDPAPGELYLAAVAEDRDPPDGVPARILDLGPLGPAAIARWARDEVDLGQLDRRDRDRLIEETAGLPGRLEPLLFRWRELRRRGEAPPPGALGDLFEASEGERGRVVRRLAALDAGRRLLLEVAAFVDPCAVAVAELQRVSGSEPEGLAEVLAAYLRAGLGVALDGDRLLFRDRVLPGVIRAAADPSMAPDLIAAARELLAPLEDGAALRRCAELTAESGDLAAAERIAWQAGRRLGEEHRALEAADVIAAWVGRSDRRLGKDEVDLVGDCARALRGAGQGERLTGLLAATGARAPAELVARLESERAGDLFTAGEYDAAGPIYLANALRARRAGDADLRLRSLVMLATIAQLTGRPDRAALIYRSLEGLAAVAAPFLLVTWLRRRAGLALKMGRESEAEDCLERAWALAREHDLDDELLLYQETAMARLTGGDRAAARELLAAGLDRARARGRSDMVAWLHHVVALYHLQGGDPDRGEKELRSSNHWAHRTGLRSLLADNHELLARIAAHRGEIEATRKAVRLARRHDSGNDNLEAQLRLGEADIALQEGDPETAKERLAAADELDAALDAESRVVRDSVALLVASGDDAAARLDELRPRLERSWSAFRCEEIARRLGARSHPP